MSRRLIHGVTLMVVFFIIMAMPQTGDTLTGLELLRQCEGRSPQRLEALGPILCVTYLSGMIDGYQLRSREAERGRQALCPPAEGIENEQMQLIVQKWLRDHPGDLGESARVSVMAALAQAFPCRR
jgi:hypothetical protein